MPRSLNNYSPQIPFLVLNVVTNYAHVGKFLLLSGSLFIIVKRGVSCRPIQGLWPSFKCEVEEVRPGHSKLSVFSLKRGKW